MTEMLAPGCMDVPVRHASGDDTHALEGSIVVYDENLLERARTQWQFGDWQSLFELSRDNMQHHPDRAKLALLAAAGRLQTNNAGDARHFIQLAYDWGVSKKLVSQILIAGVHNSIGRAAAIGNQQHRAIKHFENAISIGAPGSDVQLLTRARIGEQLDQLGLLTPESYLTVGFVEMPITSTYEPSLAKNVDALANSLKQQKEELDVKFKLHRKELAQMRDALSKVVKTEITIAIKQLEAFFKIQGYFDSGQIMGELHGWPISPDLGLYLIQQLEAKSYDLVIEFGSGTSTQLIAKTLEGIAQRDPTRLKSVQVAFEHLELYHMKTRALLQQSGIAEAVDVYHTPLKPYTGSDGADYVYYDCASALQALTKTILRPIQTILVLVDGPPGKTGRYARYPALPLLLQHFPDSQIDLILDDYSRPEEKEIVKKWVEDLYRMQKKFELFEDNLEKGVCNLIIEAKTNLI